MLLLVKQVLNWMMLAFCNAVLTFTFWAQKKCVCGCLFEAVSRDGIPCSVRVNTGILPCNGLCCFTFILHLYKFRALQHARDSYTAANEIL
jgi:hypothetical protein